MERSALDEVCGYFFRNIDDYNLYAFSFVSFISVVQKETVSALLIATFFTILLSVMKNFLMLLFFSFSFCCNAKEWKSIKAYQKATNLFALKASDWLRSDRKKNTIVWQNANIYNLTNNLPSEYVNIQQRRDFYWWFNTEVSKKGHQVVWPSMSYYISKKLRLTNAFPFNLFLKKEVKMYSNKGSINVFDLCFSDLKKIFFSKEFLKNDSALQWDKDILHNEQHIWIASIYSEMSKKDLNRLESIAKGKWPYSIMVPKEIRFTGNLKNASERFDYAIEKLRAYCIDRYR